MTLIEILILLVVAAVCGSIGQAIAGYSRGGLLVAMCSGSVGSSSASSLRGTRECPRRLTRP